MCVPAAYLVLVVRPLNILDLKSDQKWLKEKYFFFQWIKLLRIRQPNDISKTCASLIFCFPI